MEVPSVNTVNALLVIFLGSALAAMLILPLFDLVTIPLEKAIQKTA